MKIASWVAGIIVGLIIILVSVERLAAERVEVVELHTQDETGELVTTRLWIVDDGGFQYLRVGADGSGWFSRIQASETIDLTRNGTTNTYTTELNIEKRDTINDLMQAKYTWGDSFIGTLVGSRENSIPIELHPAP